MRPPFTVLDLRDSPWLDGPGRTILDCAETIDQGRFRIVIGAFDGGRDTPTNYETEALGRGLSFARITERRAWDPKVLSQILALGREYAADLIHTHDLRSDFFGYFASRRLGIPMVTTVHGWIENDWKGALKNRLDRLILRRVEHIIAVSNQTRTRLGRWADDKRCSVIPNALRVERYRPHRASGDFRKEHGISGQETVIANIGRLSPEKGQVPFLCAARDLLSNHQGLKFVLIGIGPDEQGLRELAADLGISQSVIFAGYRADMDSLYNEIDLVVQSSVTEGMPNVVLEALLMEVPVIATDVGGTREVLKDGETGVLIDPNAGGLAPAVEAYLGDRARFQQLARHGRKDVLLRFDHRSRVERLSEVYEGVLGLHGSVG